MAESQSMSISPERVGQMLQGAGYRTEYRQDANDTPVIVSATGGLSFSIRMGNRATAPLDGFLDFTYLAILKVDTPFPLERVNDWNNIKRFARLHRSEDFIVLGMDVIAAGGVSDRYLLSTLELWDRLIQEFILWLRGDAPANAA